MAHIFLSDVHLRLDRPERGQRLAGLMDSLGSEDRVVIVGDLCDFWFASRQIRDPQPCQGLESIARFRERGGTVLLLPGNHDAWMSEFYRSKVGIGYAEPKLDEVIGSVRIHAEHGHEACRQSPLKRWLKSDFFLRVFSKVPGPIAQMMGRILDASNTVTRSATDQKHIRVYRKFADTLASTTDICIFGHIHVAHDDVMDQPRLVILGGWHYQGSYLRVEHSGQAELVILNF